MTNKIVILDNSVELYEHYIDDTKWERTFAFPRGGVTYLVSNGTIKFYAFEDYLYRNCIISMQLPIRVVDENEHIDDDYEDIDELAEVLDRIFPTNDIDAELDEYLRIKDAELLYQPIGEYLTKASADTLYQPIGDYVTDEELVEALEDYYTKDETSGKTEIQDALDLKADKNDTYTKAEVDNIANGKADVDDVYTKQECDSKFQPKGDYVSASTFITYTATTNATLANKADRNELPDMTQYYTKDETSGKTEIQDALDLKADKNDTYTKDEVDEKIGQGGQFDPDDYFTKQETENRFQEKGDYVSASTYSAFTASTNEAITSLEIDKLDASAYTPYDLSNYYTKYEVYNKQEIDNKIQSGGTFDPTLYYTKDESNSRFALKTEIPSLNGYATKQWVLDKNYVTESTFNQYITNLQEQINSLINTISGCCSSSGETIYRWLTMTGENDYICSGTTKYEKQVYQESSDNGITWRNVEPTQYRKGNVIEYDCPDCGYVPEIQYRWYTAPSNEYICSGTSKYYKQYYQQSSDNGMTWVNVVPEQTRMGNLMEKNSLDCGYVTPQYRWKSADPITDYICSGTTKYYKEYYQVSNDSGQTWANVTPTQTRMGGIVNIHSTDCGEPHVADMLMTYKVTSGQSAHLLQGNVSVGFMKAELTRGTYTEVTVPPPGGNNPIYATFDYTSNDANGMIEWTSDGIHATSFSGTALHTATIYEGIVYMQGDVFVCPYLEYLELPSTFARASWTFAHDCPELKTVVVNAVTPPSILGVPFENCPKLSAIYVPDESVEAYKTHSDTRYWDVYANIIKPLSEKP